MSTAKLPGPDEPRKVIAPEPAGNEHVPHGPEHRARNSIVVWVAVAIPLLAAGLSWIFRIGGNILTFAFMVVAVIIILVNVLGVRNPPGESLPHSCGAAAGVCDVSRSSFQQLSDCVVRSPVAWRRTPFVEEFLSS